MIYVVKISLTTEMFSWMLEHARLRAQESWSGAVSTETFTGSSAGKERFVPGSKTSAARRISACSGAASSGLPPS